MNTQRIHNLVAIDLAMHQTGIAVFESEPGDTLHWKLKDTLTIKDLLNGEKYEEGSSRQLILALKTIIGKYHTLDYADWIWVEYNPQDINKALEKFQLSVGAMLVQYKSSTEFVCANHWLAVANHLAPVKRSSFPEGRAGNKKWIAECCKKLFPDYEFGSQDEMDATLMGWTMIQEYLQKQIAL